MPPPASPAPTSTAYLGAMLAIALIGTVATVLSAFFAYPHWKEWRERTKRELQGGAKRAPRSPFIPLGAAFIILFTASAVFAGVWLYLWLHAAHPTLYWSFFSVLSSAVVGLWWLLTYTATKALEDANTLRSEVARVTQETADQLRRANEINDRLLKRAEEFGADASAEALKLRKNLVEEQRGFQEMVLKKDQECAEKLSGLNMQIDRARQEAILSHQVTAFDPLVYVDILDRRAQGETPDPQRARILLLLTNRGGSEATNIHVEDVKLRELTIKFNKLPPVLAPTVSGTATPSLIGDVALTCRHDLKWALLSEWQSRHNMNLAELSVSLAVTYCDPENNVIETTCELVFNALEESRILKQGADGRSSLSTRDFKFQRLSTAIK